MHTHTIRFQIEFFFLYCIARCFSTLSHLLRTREILCSKALALSLLNLFLLLLLFLSPFLFLFVVLYLLKNCSAYFRIEYCVVMVWNFVWFPADIFNKPRVLHSICFFVGWLSHTFWVPSLYPIHSVVLECYFKKKRNSIVFWIFPINSNNKKNDKISFRLFLV